MRGAEKTFLGGAGEKRGAGFEPRPSRRRCRVWPPLLAGDAARVAGRLRGGRLRARRMNLFLIVALLARARAGRALLRRLLEHEGRVALGARLGDRLVPVDGLALRVLRAAVEILPALRLLDDYLALATGARAHDAGR